MATVRARLPGVEVVADASEPLAIGGDVEADEKTQELLARSMAAVYADDAKNEGGKRRERDGEGDKEEKDSPEEDDPTTDDAKDGRSSDDGEYVALDADAILKQIVNRKCEMEGMEHFDLKHTMTVRGAGNCYAWIAA